MRSTLARLAAFQLLLVACGQEPERAKVANSDSQASTDPVVIAEQTFLSLAQEKLELENSLKDFQRRTRTDEAELAILSEVNRRMCDRLQLLREECRPAARLMADPFEKNLRCAQTSENDTGVRVANFSVNIASAPGVQFQLVADNQYFSNVLKEGLSSVTWNSDLGYGIRAPRFYEIRNLRLKAVSGSLPALDTFTFELLVNDKPIVSRANLVPSADPTYFNIRTDGFLTERQSSACRVAVAEIENIQEDVRKEVADANPELNKGAPSQPTATPLPTPDYSASAPTTPRTAEELQRLRDALQVLRPEVEKQKSLVANQKLELERERDRQGKLSHELLGDAAVGCFARQPIKKFEVIVNGTHLEDGALFETAQKPAPSGSPAQVKFQFGQFMTYTNADEEQLSILKQQGGFVTQDFSTNRIGDIEHISISKGGIDFRSFEKCTQVWIFGKDCKFQNVETKRYRIDSVTVMVNDEMFYKRDGINHILQGNSLNWEDRNIAVNPEFLDLMKRDDCPVDAQ